MQADSIEVLAPKKTTKRVINLSGPARRRQPPKRLKGVTSIKPPVPIAHTPESLSFQAGSNIVDNTKSTARRRKNTNYGGLKQSNFLITMVPNSSVREEINPELYKKLKDEIRSFADFVLDPSNMKHILEPAPGNDDKDWFKKIVKLGDEKVASIEDSKDTNKRLHTHIFYPVSHKTALRVNRKAVVDIAKSILEPVGIKNPHIDINVEKKTSESGAREYVVKLGEGKDGELIE